MKIFIISLFLSFHLLHSCHGLRQHQHLTNFLRDRRCRINNKQEWSASYITKHDYNLFMSQDGFQEDDRITALPGQPPHVTFAQYSGYVTVDSNAGRALFYYFAEATEDPSTKPLLLWLNGGPGCSSFGVGAMTELGPFRVASDNKTLYTNPYAWNKVANTLFLESPVGVGFSYSNTSSDSRNGTDTKTARDSYMFLLNWFERFPQYKFRDFYIAGESYAGFYIPQLADTILSNNNSQTSFINLKGVMIGNGIMNDDTDYCGLVDYIWSHALISDEDYQSSRCKNMNESTEINGHKLAAKAQIHPTINYYNIYAPLCSGPPETKCPSSISTDAVMPTDGLGEFDPCSPKYVYSYLNTPQVQKALHANVTSLPYEWTECSILLGYESTASTMFPIYRRMIAAGLKILVYSEDVDAVVPVTGTRYGINAMTLEIETPWYPWRNSEIDVGGFSVVYKGGLTFTTVRGAGHQVPSYQPSRALTMIKFFLEGKALPSA